MSRVASGAIAADHALEAVLRRDRGRLLAGLIARLQDFQLAEDALQEASVAALKHWGRAGLPRDPLAWLLRAGLNKGIDQIRKAQRAARTCDALPTPGGTTSEPEDIPDDRLRLIFTCCHPALDEKSRVALTLRSVCGLTTPEIAALFLDREATMGQRLSRAKAQIRDKGIAFAVPEPALWADRLGTVLSTLYLIFTTGYVTEDASPRDLCREGIFLTRLLNDLHPGDAEIEGALALMLLTEARRVARIDDAGVLVPVEAQDAAVWDKPAITEAQTLLQSAMARRQPGPFQIKAALADCHMMSPAPDWAQMALLYGALLRQEPSPVVALNHAVVLAELGQVEAALARIDALGADLASFQPWHAARAHCLALLGRPEARAAYDEAIARAPNLPARKYLEARAAGLDQA